ncbi:uncharacterized protein LOC131884843 [Tigriopus californicus]|uniref:uncharacterized protein LOC131884843 n=1 Tax=Tigriopus californicus TaxID=6832 RepID=UPI0027DA72F5|nr:uncharacterized protein LOC131884843 [Tigriopus californicus]
MRTRPDLAFAVATVAKFGSHPGHVHWSAVTRILRYLQGTLELGISYSRTSTSELVGFLDSDWAGDPEDRKSTSSYVFMLAGGPISWKNQKQKSVALSTAVAEYMAPLSTAQEALWLRNVLLDMGVNVNSPTTIFEDNLASIGLAKNPQYHGRAKHISIRYHFRREQVQLGTIVIKYCKTEDMVADMLTKAAARPKLQKLNRLCNVGVRSIE